MDPILHDFKQARRDLFHKVGIDEHKPETLHEADGIRARDDSKRAILRYRAVGDQWVEMEMKACGDITVALQGGDHAGEEGRRSPVAAWRSSLTEA